MLLYALMSWNLCTFFLMGLDKFLAVHHRWRISEATLLVTALIGGGIGAFIASHLFHHKTQKTTFRVLLPIGVLITLYCFYVIMSK